MVNKGVRRQKSDYIKLKNYERKIKSPFMIYSDFESILVQEDNGKQKNLIRTSMKNVVYSYDYKLLYVDDKFSKRFKSYLGKNAVYNFINSMIKESNYRCKVMKNILKKSLWWLKKIMKILKTLITVGSVKNLMLLVMLK